MFCVKCGKPLGEGTRFCLSCGAVQDTVDFGQEMELPPDPDIPDITETAEDGFDEGAMPLLGDSKDDSSGIADEVDDFDEKSTPEDYDEETPDVSEEALDPAPVRRAKVMKPERPHRKPMSVAPTALICILFSVLTLVFGMGSSALWAIRDLLTNGFVSTEAKSLNPLYLNANDIITDPAVLEKALSDSGIADVKIGEIGANETLGDLIERTLADYGLNEEKTEKLLSSFMPFVSDVAAAYETYLLTGKDTKPITDETIKSTALGCMDVASKELGFKFRPDSERRMEEFFRNNRDLIRKANPTEALGVGGSYIRYAFSVPVIVALSVLAVVMAALAGFITRRADAAFISFGIPMFISGVALLYVGLFPRVVLASAGIPSIAVSDGIEQYAAVFTRLGAAELVLGVVFIAAFAVYRVLASKIAKKKALQSA